MKTIAVQNGLNEISDFLKTNGYDIVSYEETGLKADAVIISGVDSAYEEIETAQCRLRGTPEEHSVLLINSSGLSPDQVLTYIKNYHCE